MTRLQSEQALAPVGLRPRHLVTLTVLGDHGSETQQALAAAVQIDPTNLVGLLNELETAGFVTRERDPEDRRRHIVSITEGGRDKLAAARAALGGVEDELLAVLDHDERAQLYDLLQRVSASHVTECTGQPTETAACREAAKDAEDDSGDCDEAIAAVHRATTE